MTGVDPAVPSTLRGRLPAPRYDRAPVRAGIVHIGLGGFARAHLAMYLHRLMEQGEGLDWGICGVGVRDADRAMRDVMRRQNGLYTLVLQRPDGALEATVVGSVVDYLFAPDDPDAVIERLASPETRIVSLTITEGGYHVSDSSGRFETEDPAVLADLSPGAVPQTVFGLVTAALGRRRSRGIAPFTIMSCDNMPGNGDIARESFTAFARLRDPELASWIAAAVAFPNSMVDRITPATTKADRAMVRERIGGDDLWPVVAEPFVQWVLQDLFSAGRPPLERAGVQIVQDVEPYELMKLRILNGSHQGLAYFGYLLGHRYVHEAAQDPLLRAFLHAYIEEEAIPTLPVVPGTDLRVYGETVLERFANPNILDTLARVAAHTSDRIPKFVLPVVRDRIAMGGDVRRAAAIVASWARYAEGIDEQGESIEVVDRIRDELVARARRQREEPLAFLDRRIFGDLVDEPAFTGRYVEALTRIRTEGVRRALEAAL